MYFLRLLGGVSLEGPEGPVGGRIGQRRNLAFLALLARAPRRALSRDALAAYLWPEASSSRARQYLSSTIYVAREALGRDAIRTPGDAVELDVEVVESDVDAFEAALEAGAWDEAAARYDGPFLDGFHLRDTNEFENWVEAERAELHRRYATALEELAEAAEDEGDHSTAVEWWRRRAGADPLSSRVAVRLMEALAAAGDRAGALRHARTFEVLLREELDLDLPPAVTDLVERLRDPDATFASPQDSPDDAGAGRPPGAKEEEQEETEAPPTEPRVDSPGDGESPEGSPSPPAKRFPFPLEPRWIAGIAVVAVVAVGALLLDGPLRSEKGSSTGGSLDAPGTSQPSIAVLYLESLSPDSADLYLAEGLTEELTSRLGQLDWLRVQARTSVRRFRGPARPDPVAIGDTLGVRYLVEGSVRRGGERIRISVRLIDARNGFRIWAEDYDATVADLLSVQERIATRVAESLGERLNPWERALLAQRATDSPEAYDHFLRGNHLLDKRTPSSVLRATDEYRAAATIDPDFTAAIARTALAYGLFPDWGWDHPAASHAELLADGLRLAERALRQDPTAAEAWLARAYLLEQQAPENFGRALEAFERAIALDPTNAQAYQQYGDALKLTGRNRDAGRAIRRAVALEPDLAYPLIPLSVIEFRAGRHDEARRWIDSAIVLDPDLAYARSVRGIFRLAWDEPAAAREDAMAALRADRTYPVPARAVLARSLARMGDTVAAGAQLDLALEAISDTLRPGPTDTRFLASAMLELGQTERALEFIERARPRGPWLWYYLEGGRFDEIRTDPTFQQVMAEARAEDRRHARPSGH